MIATRIRVSVLLLTALLGMGACGQGDPPPPPPPPPGAIHGITEGVTPEQDTAASYAFVDLARRVREHFDGPWDADYYRLPVGTTWDSVVAHYAGALGEGWTEDTRYAPDAGPGYRSKLWHDGDFLTAVALLDDLPPSTTPIIIVLVSEED
ncbi:hypothetical protein RB614_23185 [Phytohabitans sp. ZYX-F-186]|uniref:Lipoprotein n=1 Tax=Phytohabitans maris TaxID=3071409 RepID=A0ABU0ZK47_9ACTN|nr:hypothetical protein [Phytohabitans sp. ZYX-F-186]MDQ7907426.1 hypothetical protein [Phytohabitans sp. ZYX-F-186]